MRTATEWFEIYGTSHKNPVNKTIHWVAIPLIVLSTLGLFQAIPHPLDIPGVHVGTLVVLASMVFYMSLSWTVALGMLGVAGTCLTINAGIAHAGLPIGWVSLGIFATAWVAQFIGHKIEGKKPSFFEDLQFLLIGPAWLLQFIYKKVGIPVETWRVSVDSAA
jgi:uncharacterized membrane protein YGL010W